MANQSKRKANAQKGRPNRKKPYVSKIPDGRGTKNQRRVEEIDDTSAAIISSSNPVGWYQRYKEFADDATRIPTSVPLGVEFNPFRTLAAINNSVTIPGVMRLGFTPTAGYSTDMRSPLNKSSINFFTYQRSIQKASWDYDHQDVTMMLYSMDSAYMFHMLMRRAYGVIRNFTPMNLYYPKALVAAMGFDYEDLVSNLADFREYINSFGLALGQYVMPEGLMLTDRHTWMCEGVYLDSNTDRAQTYLFVPDAFWQYDNTVQTGSQLTLKPWVNLTTDISTSGTLIYHTFEEVKKFGDELINAVSGDQDFAFISGDFYNLFGHGRQVPHTPDLYTVIPVYDQTVATQIENATIVGYTLPDNVISQNPSVNAGAIICELGILPNQSEVDNADKKVTLNFHTDSPSPDMVMEATRLVAESTVSGTGADLKVTITDCATEVINQIKILSYNASGNFTITGASSSVLNVTAGDSSQRIQFIADMTQFDWAPMLWIAYTNGQGIHYQLGAIADIDNVTTLPDNQLSYMHQAALYSLFDIPSKRMPKE